MSSILKHSFIIDVKFMRNHEGMTPSPMTKQSSTKCVLNMSIEENLINIFVPPLVDPWYDITENNHARA